MHYLWNEKHSNLDSQIDIIENSQVSMHHTEL